MQWKERGEGGRERDVSEGGCVLREESAVCAEHGERERSASLIAPIAGSDIAKDAHDEEHDTLESTEENDTGEDDPARHHPARSRRGGSDNGEEGTRTLRSPWSP